MNATAAYFIDATFTTGGFWPVVVARDWIEGWRIPTDLKEAMSGQCLLLAIIETVDALQPAKAAAVALGYSTLAAYITAVCPDEMINEKPVLESLFLSAVGNLAKAKTIKRQQAQIRKPLGEAETLGADNQEQYFADEHQSAVGRIINRMVGNGGRTNFGVYVASIGD